MKKLLAVMLGLAFFLVVLTLYIVPQQGGYTPATELKAEELSRADPRYEETLPLQEVDLGVSGRSMIIALVMLVHILFANLHFGGAWIAVLTESIFLRTNRTRYKRLARSLTFFNVILFSTGATFAIAGTVFFVALYPELTKNLFHIYWWPLLLEALTFVLEIFFLYTYWYSWDRIRPFWHQVLGFGYAIDVFIQVLLINMVASGMMTPGGHEIIWSGSGMLTMDWTEALS